MAAPFRKEKEVMPVLDREAILQADDIKIEPVEVPEWGGTVLVKGMTGAERDRFETAMIENPGKSSKVNLRDMRAKLCSLTIVNENGKLLFTPADIKELTKKSALALQRVFEVARDLSGIGDDDVEELTEGLEDVPFGDSASD